jgi:hypothetical protein
MTKTMMVSTCSSNIGHFDGHGNPPVQYKAHCPMQHVQGYSGCHWTPPLATTRSVLPQQPPEQQANKQQSTNTHK